MPTASAESFAITIRFAPGYIGSLSTNTKAIGRRLKWFGAKGAKSPTESHDPTRRLDAGIWVRRVFKALTTEERALISLYEMEGWSIVELSELHGKPLGNDKIETFASAGKNARRTGKISFPG